MNTHNTTYLAAMLALSLLPACSRMEKTPAPGTGSGIRFAAPIQTRATVDVSTSDVFQIRDWHSSNSYHIVNTLKYHSNLLDWDYGTSPSSPYEWTYGTHLFFSWLDHDDSYSTLTFFGGEPAPAGNTLTFPARRLGNDVPQYDFLYSNPVVRSTADNDYSDVPLVFNHLFALVSITFKVSDQEPDDPGFTLQQIYLNGNLNTNKAATIIFSEDGTANVNLTDGEAGSFFRTIPTEFAKAFQNTTPAFDVLSQQDKSEDFYFFWPASAEELQAGVITVKYQLTGESTPRTATLSFPKGTTWQGGHRYSYTIQYKGNVFKVEESVLPWEQVSYPTETEDLVSVMATWVGWDTNTCEVNGTEVRFKPDGEGGWKDIRGMFKIFSPTPCTYYIGLTNNSGSYFSITPDQGTVGDEGDDIKPGVTIEFTIHADSAAPEGASTNLAFSLQASVPGPERDFSLDSELQRDGTFQIIIPTSE